MKFPRFAARAAALVAAIAAIVVIAIASNLAASAAAQTPVPRRAVQSCPAGQYLYWNATAGLNYCSTTAPATVVSSLTIDATLVTSSAAELNIMDGVTATATEINKLAGVTGGTTAASKGLVVDANKRLDELVLGTLKLGAGAGTAVTPSAAQINLLTQGVAGGYKIARGMHTTVDEDDTVVTGLATVVAALCQFQSAPSVTAMFVACDIGDQSGAPAAGSIFVKTYQPTAVNDVTPIAATAFSKAIAWIAIGT